MARYSRSFILAVVVSFSFLILLYSRIFGFNERPAANFEMYPSAEDMAASLMCMDPDDPDRRLDFESLTANETGALPLFQPPLQTEGRYIIDKTGQRIKLVSINWYGASDVDFVPGGLDVRHRKDIARTIRMMGFNSVRLPYADEMVRSNPVISKRTLRANHDLFLPDQDRNDKVRALDVFHAVVKSLSDEGLAVIINNHITQARWCCDANLCDASWSNDYLGNICRVSQTEDDWIENWVTIMHPHIDNPFVVGADLRNEVRSPLNKRAWNPWAAAAERLSTTLLAMQPAWLIFVEGVGSSNFLQGVRTRPVQLPVPNRLVYSVHVYGWSGWGSVLKGPYWNRPFESFAADMYNNWAFLLDEGIAPVWVGEIGSPDRPNTGDLHYWTNLVEFLDATDADWAYWAINPRKPAHHENESYSLIHDDWATPRCDYRLHDLATLGLGGRPADDEV